MSKARFLRSGGRWGILLAGLCLAAAAGADIHRCVEPGGAVVYTDQGCPAAADAPHKPADMQGPAPAADKSTGSAKPAAAPAAAPAADPAPPAVPEKK